MPRKDTDPDHDGELETIEETCKQGDHLSDLDAQTKLFISVFATVRSKTEDLARARSDAQKFELSIEAERKRLQKNLENAKLGLRNARVQMSVELAKVDPVGFEKVAQLVKEVEGA